MIEALQTLGWRIVGVLGLALLFGLAGTEIIRWHRRRSARKAGRRG